MRHDRPDPDPDTADYRGQLAQQLAFERLVAELSTEFIHAPAERLDALIEHALGQLGALFGVDRAYLFRFSDDRSLHSNTHEWVAEGISREAHNLQDVPVTVFPWLMAELRAGRSVHVPRVSELPQEAHGERSEFDREGIRSLVVVPYGDSGDPEGFVGFDSVRRERRWPPEIRVGLRLVGQMIYNALRAQRMAQQLADLAFQDPLTGLGNRRQLRDRLGWLIERSSRGGGRIAVLLVDLDDFKLVNDGFGHSLGDELLRTVAARLGRTVRGSDLVTRPGGDEFVIVSDTADAAPLTRLVQRLFEAMSEPVELAGVVLDIRMSIGIALYPDDGGNAEELLRQADTAMYAAKGAGKNRFAFFSPEMDRASRLTLQLRHELSGAIEQGAVLPYYQPRVRLPSREVVGFEALARWQHPQRGLLLPADFLELAEQSGLGARLDLRMLAAARADLARWRRHGAVGVSVNLGARHLYDDDFIDSLLRLLDGDVGGLELEITESSLMHDIARAARTLARLRERAPALRIAIDDFGSGYSALAYLGRLPVTTLKIDRSFTAQMDGADRRAARAVVRSIIELGGELGLHVVAEGVESLRQLDELVALGCPEGQGYLFARPRPVAAADALLQRRLLAPAPR